MSTTPDSAELEAAREGVRSSISEYLRVMFPEVYGADGDFPDADLDPASAGDPYLVAWVVSVEVTNARLQQGRMSYRYAFADPDQLASASEGLARTIERSFAPGRLTP